MKKIFGLCIILCLTICMCLTSCEKVKVDYENATDFETALNEGKDVTGKIVEFTVDEVKPNSAFGYNLVAGEHLNFCSDKNPDVEAGDTITVEVTEVSSMLKSWIIYYEIVD